MGELASLRNECLIGYPYGMVRSEFIYTQNQYWTHQVVCVYVFVYLSVYVIIIIEKEAPSN